jgi:hypothetical protein
MPGVGQPGGGDGRRHRVVRARGEHVDVVDHERLQNGHDLRGRLAGTEHGFGSAGAQRAVQIDFGEAEIGVRQIAQSRHRRVGGQTTTGHRVEQVPQRLTIHSRDRASTANSPSRTGTRPDRR